MALAADLVGQGLGEMLLRKEGQVEESEENKEKL